MWRRGGAKRFFNDSPDGRPLAVFVPCAGRGFRVFLLLLPSMVLFLALGWIVRDGFDSPSVILGSLPLRSVWVVGGDFNAEIGLQGVGEGLYVGSPRIWETLGLGINWWKGPRVRTFVFFCLSRDRFVGIPGFTPKVGRGIQLTIFFVGVVISGF